MKSSKYNDLLQPLKSHGKEVWLSVRKMINTPLEFKEEFMERLGGKSLKDSPFYNNEQNIDKFFIAIAALGKWK